jgi:hypothetical protein
LRERVEFLNSLCSLRNSGEGYYETELEPAFLAKIEKIPVWTDYTAEEQAELIRIFVEQQAKDFSQAEKDAFSSRLLNASLLIVRLF